MSLKKIFNSALIIACCTAGGIGAIKKYKHVFLTRPVFSHVEIPNSTLVIQKQSKAQPDKVRSSILPMPNIDRMDQLFSTQANKFPIVETVSFNSKVDWLEGRFAWIADYASHFKTSRHFIARSLNGKADYFSQKVSSGNKFNVYRIDRPFEFHLALDLSACQMSLYYYDLLTNERVLIKTYSVSVGRKDETKDSGFLTPVGTYKIGSKIAIYKPGVMGTFQDEKIEMIRVFGTRWLPIEACDEAHAKLAKGLGFHGLPWEDSVDGEYLTEDLTSIGCYSSDGCIRLAKDDIEELFAVVITKPCLVHVADTMVSIELPGLEVVQPSR